MDELTNPEAAAKGRSKVCGGREQSATPAASQSTRRDRRLLRDAEDLVGEDAKLGKAAARVSYAFVGRYDAHDAFGGLRLMLLVPTAPFYGSKVVEITDLTKVFDFINETALFKGQWQYKQGRKSPEEYEAILRGNGLSEVCRDQGQGDPREAARGQACLRLFSVSRRTVTI